MVDKSFLDRNGMLWFAALTDSQDFPTTPDALYPTFMGGGGAGREDIFLMKFNTRQPEIAYSTFLGGSALELESDIDVDAEGNAYIVSSTTSSDSPPRRRGEGI